MIGPTDLLHPSPAPHFKTFEAFLICCPERPSFSTIQSHAPNVALKHSIHWKEINIMFCLKGVLGSRIPERFKDQRSARCEDVWGCGDRVPPILNFCTAVVSHIIGERVRVVRAVECWIDPRAGLDFWRKEKFLPLHGIERLFLRRPVCSLFTTVIRLFRLLRGIASKQ